MLAEYKERERERQEEVCGELDEEDNSVVFFSRENSDIIMFTLH